MRRTDLQQYIIFVNNEYIDVGFYNTILAQSHVQRVSNNRLKKICIGLIRRVARQSHFIIYTAANVYMYKTKIAIVYEKK